MLAPDLVLDLLLAPSLSYDKHDPREVMIMATAKPASDHRTNVSGGSENPVQVPGTVAYSQRA